MKEKSIKKGVYQCRYPKIEVDSSLIEFDRVDRVFDRVFDRVDRVFFDRVLLPSTLLSELFHDT